ncbi:hypothetical protein [Paenibacillus sp.]|uniref:hypothetical protein n=1 Tax=Paenibacillus sp. TaxID=58172 RepID=UPI0035643AF1
MHQHNYSKDAIVGLISLVGRKDTETVLNSLIGRLSTKIEFTNLWTRGYETLEMEFFSVRLNESEKGPQLFFYKQALEKCFGPVSKIHIEDGVIEIRCNCPEIGLVDTITSLKKEAVEMVKWIRSDLMSIGLGDEPLVLHLGQIPGPTSSEVK